MRIGVIVLAGGKGSRMGAEVPKQLLLLNGKPILHYSLDLFSSLSFIEQIVLVIEKNESPFLWSPPGQRRQDSVWNGLKALDRGIEWICIHDAARPFIDAHSVRAVIEGAQISGAAALAMPVQATLKQVDSSGKIIKTIEREGVWEMQTPQVVRRDILEKGFTLAHEKQLTVTDDVALAELAGVMPHIIQGSRYNFKITVPEDLFFAECYVKKYML